MSFKNNTALVGTEGSRKVELKNLPPPPSFLQSIHVAIFVLFMSATTSACEPPDCAPAGGWANFANNLGTDLAPLLALFGEQITIQYLNESLSWVDCLLFALAPLGIITAMVSAIRVAGRPMLRSLIGRAKESRGTVEADLMSSTSLDVCELWNGEGVVRVLGSPVLLQLVYTGTKDDTAAAEIEDNAGIYTFDEAIQLGFYEKKGGSGRSAAPEEIPMERIPLDTENFQARQNPPNLSLNVSIKRLDPRIMASFVVLGVLLQAGVLVFAALAQYRLKLQNNGVSVPDYSFPVILGGTLSLGVGIFLCARAVETSTEETTWQSTTGGCSKAVIWLQQGGQTVGDQRFESFARRSTNKSPDNTIKTSAKMATTEGATGRSALVTVAICTTLISFTAQFVGLRAMHPSVTVAQLAVVLIMTTLRSCAHIQRSSHNDIKYPDEVEGYELDWLAKDLGRCETWEVITGPDIPLKSSLVRSDGAQAGAMAVLKTRARLARLSSDWKLESRNTVQILQNAIEETINDIFANMVVDDDLKDSLTFKWSVPVKAKFSSLLHSTTDDTGPQFWQIDLTLNRTRDENSNWRAWKTDKSQLEAVLCLWVSSLTVANREQAKKGSRRLKHIRLLGPATEETKVDYRVWIHRGTTPNEMTLKPKEERYFGWNTSLVRDDSSMISPATSYLYVNAEGELDKLCAQELYASCISQLVSRIVEVGGSTARRSDDFPTGGPVQNDNDNDWWQFRLNNSYLASLATIYYNSGLGTIEEAYFCIVPAFRSVEKLPYPHQAYMKARTAPDKLDEEGLWEKATEIDSWLYSNTKRANISLEDIAIITAEIGNRLLRLTRRLVTGIESDDRRRRMWGAGFLRCQLMQEASQNRAISLVNLCRTSGKIEHHLQSDQNNVFQLAFDTVQSLDATDENTMEIAADLALLSCEMEFFDQAEALAKSVWFQTIARHQAERRNHQAREMFVDIRRKRGSYLQQDILERYLSDPKHLQLAAKASVHTRLCVQDIEDGQVPIDLLLARGHRTPLQLAAENGHTWMIQQLLNAKADVNAAPAAVSGRTALQAAAEAGCKDSVKLLLDHGADVDDISSGRTALQAAAGAGYNDVVGLLLAGEAKVNAEAGKLDGRTALQAAADSGHLAIVEFLLSSGADVNAKAGQSNGRTALQAAADSGHLAIVEHLLGGGADVNATPCTSHGRTALQAAADSGHLQIVERLLASGADVNAEAGQSNGRTALQAAVGSGHLAIVERLLASGVDMNARANGRTALQAAADSGHLAIVERLLASGADVNAEAGHWNGRTALHAAADSGHLAIVEHLLASGADVNAEVGKLDGRTALQAAADAGHLAIVERLLASGADVNAEACRDNGRTALQAAVYSGHLAIVERLLASGADVNAEAGQSNGRTALQVAAYSGHLAIVERLLASEADVNAEACRDNGRTALQAAADSGHLAIVECLLASRADVNAKACRNTGRTALQAAADSGHLAIVERLLASGADVNAEACRYHGRTALQAAAGSGHLAIVERLLASGADVNAKAVGWAGRTALQAATYAGHLAIVERLLAAVANIGGLNALQDHPEIAELPPATAANP